MDDAADGLQDEAEAAPAERRGATYQVIGPSNVAEVEGVDMLTVDETHALWLQDDQGRALALFAPGAWLRAVYVE